ncbi:hypothetical protein BDA96_04G306000 [Sorghum bicolor]|uniref:Secreted protein n=1 Tax=Sorghum bicolor TaxID=4558 RepID=A0A921UKS3_SORBI|nr:hypothetical protein BDA96_04G306000 [Sorghum bicolor]
MSFRWGKCRWRVGLFGLFWPSFACRRVRFQLASIIDFRCVKIDAEAVDRCEGKKFWRRESRTRFGLDPVDQSVGSWSSWSGDLFTARRASMRSERGG